MYCEKCGAKHDERAMKCANCGYDFSRNTRADVPQAGNAVASTPGVAVASLVLGLLGLFCFVPIFGIPAIICGHVARKQINRSSGRLTGGGLALAGLILGYVGIVVSILMLVAIAVPNIIKSRQQSQANACISNLKQIEEAKEKWALEGNDASHAPVPGDLREFIRTDFVCPSGGLYEYNDLGTDPECSVHGTLPQALVY